MEELENKKVSIEKLEDKYIKVRQKSWETLEASEKLLEEANKKLKMAVKKGDFTQVRVAQTMLEGVEKNAKNRSYSEGRGKQHRTETEQMEKSVYNFFLCQKGKKKIDLYKC